jgi:flagellar FliJ protein
VSARRDRLRVVLRVRQIQEERRQGDLARATAAALEAEGASAAARHRYEERARHLPAADPASFVGARTLAVARAAHVAQAATQHALAVGESDRARALLTEAMTRTQGLERLVERADVIRLRELLAADQRAAEESASASRRRVGVSA